MIRSTSEIYDEAYKNQAYYEEDFRDGKDKFGFSKYLYGCKRIH